MGSPEAAALKQLAAKQDESGLEDFTKPQAVFNIDVVDRVTGKRYTGAFRAKAPTLADNTTIGLVSAMRAGGSPWDSIPPVVRRRIEVLATFEVLLVGRPPWFNDPSSFYGEDVISAVYEKILQHWHVFFRSGPDPGRSESPAEQSGGEASSLEG
jgi:hypothetical protein